MFLHLLGKEHFPLEKFVKYSSQIQSIFLFYGMTIANKRVNLKVDWFWTIFFNRNAIPVVADVVLQRDIPRSVVQRDECKCLLEWHSENKKGMFTKVMLYKLILRCFSRPKPLLDTGVIRLYSRKDFLRCIQFLSPYIQSY